MKNHPIRIKMCGMTRKEDIEDAIFLGVDAIGLIFYAGSRRVVSIEQAKKLLAELPLFMTTVAVFVNPTAAEVKQVIQELPIHWLQFHGNEPPEFCSEFHLPYIKAISASSATKITQAMTLYQDASAILLDTPAVESYGGTGRVFNWATIPKKRSKPIILAGGLTATNVAYAVSCIFPAAVDVCSGIEQSPGIKDHTKMVQFVKALRK